MRGIFYAAREISSQLDREFKIPHYNNIKKVYSIWICMNAPGYIGNAIAKYFIVKRDVVAGIPDNPKAYYKLSVVMICLNEKKEKRNELLEMLNHLLSANETAEEKKRILDKQFEISMENEMGRSLNIMCNLSDYVEEQAMEKGMTKGKEEGRKEGRKDVIRELVQKKLKKGKSLEEIADALEETVDVIQKIIAEAAN